MRRRLADAEPLALFAYLRLRSDVFVVEQGCVYPDMDDHDLAAWHLTGTDGSGRLLAVGRLLPPGEKYAEPSLGRVIVTRAARGTGAGHLLVDEALRKAAAEYPGYGHRIQAQAYLERFYGSHGFEPEGEVYLEDGIPHIDMTLTPGLGLLGLLAISGWSRAVMGADSCGLPLTWRARPLLSCGSPVADVLLIVHRCHLKWGIFRS
jgi:ElaA protein